MKVLGSDSEDSIYYCALGNFWFIVSEKSLKLTGPVEEAVFALKQLKPVLPNLSNNRKFLNMMHSNPADLEMAAEVFYKMLEKDREDIDQLKFSAVDFSSQMLHLCNVIKRDTGMTLIEAERYSLKTFDTPDKKFIQNLTKGTSYEKDVPKSICLLNQCGIAGLLVEVYYEKVSAEPKGVAKVLYTLMGGK